MFTVGGGFKFFPKEREGEKIENKIKSNVCMVKERSKGR